MQSSHRLQLAYCLLAVTIAICVAVGLWASLPAASATDASQGVPRAIREYDPQIKEWRQAARTPSLTQTATISGMLYATDATTPITSNAWVSVLNPATGLFEAGTTVNGDGSFAISGLALNTYIVRAEGTTYALEFYDEAGADGSNATQINLTASGEGDVNFTLDPGGTISGTVFAADGTTPLGDINVGLDGGWLGTCTASDGTFSIPSVPLDAPVKLFAGGVSWCPNGTDSYQREWWQEAGSSANATTLTLDSNNPSAADLNFTLDEGGSISGFIYQMDGTTPITTGVGVSVLAPNSDGTSSGSSATVMANGAYRISGLADGDYIVKAEGTSYAIEFYDEAGLSGTNADTVNVTTGNDTSGVDFTLDAGGTISGTVFAAGGATPLANLNVGIEGTWINVCTDANGQYTLVGVPQNRPIKVYAGGVNWCRNNLHEFARQYWQQQTSGADATTITLNASNTNQADINFAIEPIYFQHLPILFKP